MYTLFILFFISLFGIVFMIARKLTLLKKEKVLISLNNEEVLLEIPHLEKMKHHTFETIKKYGHLGLVTVLRWYIKFSNLLKNKYEEIKIKRQQAGDGEKKETSKFLKMISGYKHKIRKIKQKIHEEEKKL
ncbi:MAG: hypothetical protein WD963_00490 [Candidatus Paceibacterota bacterium]